MLKMNIPPPSFVSDSKSYEEYREDLQRWSRITSVDKKLQAEVVVYGLDGHPSQIKDKVVTKIGTTLVGAEDGLQNLLSFSIQFIRKTVWLTFGTGIKHFQTTVGSQQKTYLIFFRTGKCCIKN